MGCISADRNRRWPLATVFFEIDIRSWPAANRAGVRSAISGAIADWEANTPLRFVPRTDEPDYVTFSKEIDGIDLTGSTSCYSIQRALGPIPWAPAIGRISGQQFILCIHDAPTQRIFTHEIGHAVGFYHEQQRPDRDTFITLSPALASDLGNYGQHADAVADGPYSCTCIMHYSARTGMSGRTGGCTTTSLGASTAVGASEIAAAATLYGGASLSVGEVVRGCMGMTGEISLRALEPTGSGSLRRKLLRLEADHCT